MKIDVRIVMVVASFALAITSLPSSIRADEKADPSGVWSIKIAFPGRPANESTLRLEQASDKIIGVMTDFRGRSTPIKDAELKDGQLSFHLTFKAQDREFSFLYKGKITSDSFKGTVKADFGGRKLNFPFDGKRKKEESGTATANLAGTWKLKVPFKSDEIFEPTLKLTQKGSVVSGTYVGQGETRIGEALVLGNEFTFEVAQDRDGKKYRLRYQGKVNGDTIKGSVDYDFDGIIGILDFDGHRIK